MGSVMGVDGGGTGCVYIIYSTELVDSSIHSAAMFFAWYVLGALLSALIGIAVKTWLRPMRLPGPREFPLYEEILDLFRPFKDTFPNIKKYTDKWGGVFEIFRMGRYYVILSEPETVEAVLSSSAHTKKGEFDYAFLKPWLKEGLLLSEGNKWRNRRKILTPAFHFKILEDAMGSLSKNANNLANKLLMSDGVPTEIDDAIRSSTLNVILETAMGLSSVVEDKSFINYIETMKRVPESIMRRYYQFWKHFEFLYKRSSEGKSFYKDIENLHSFTKEVIAKRKQQYFKEGLKGSESKNKKKPFLDCLIEMDFTNPGVISADDICEEVDTFMFEGHDTTASALNSALFLLANHPLEQEKAAEEQKEIFGDDSRTPTLHDLQKMEYLDMVIKETLRLYPSVPMISRSLTQDLKIDEDTVVPAGYTAVIIPYIVHRSKNHWEDPEEFRPERFAPGISRHPFSFIPFSAGPRNCIGQKFAMMEMKTMLSEILRKCKLEPVTTAIDVLPTIVLKTETAIKIKVIPRN